MAGSMNRRAASAVTPLILTYNEDVNLGRALTALQWARRVVILDSGSSDRTEEIAKSFANVDWHVHRFDSHGSQWLHGIERTGIDTEYVLALDADMRGPEAFMDELERDFLGAGAFAGALIPFEYWVLGRPLRGSILKPQLRLFRRSEITVRQPGHGQQFHIEGPRYRFRSPLIHDDRKAFEQWLAAQTLYSRLEARRIRAGGPGLRVGGGGLKDGLRRTGVMPIVAASIAYLRAGGPLGGPAARRYALERLVFEAMLAIRLAGEADDDGATTGATT